MQIPQWDQVRQAFSRWLSIVSGLCLAFT
uniref:Uncharacterized protein n=1 Tax=Arundo donax TaxID=35708 RepID=A0A0A9GVT8_ARUDO